jgi:hypothetical protein
MRCLAAHKDGDSSSPRARAQRQQHHNQQRLVEHLRAPTAFSIPVGAHHGEAFTHVRMSGNVSVMDVDRINDQMRFVAMLQTDVSLACLCRHRLACT